MSETRPYVVTLIGYGAIGRRTAELLTQGVAPAPSTTPSDAAGTGTPSRPIVLAGAVTRTPGRAARDGVREITIEEALDVSDAVIECAGGGAVREYGRRVLRAGRDLLVVSIGALADPRIRQELLLPGPGRCLLSTGAIGGLDLIAAAAVEGGIDRVELTSTKRPRALVQPWMSEAQAQKLLDLSEACCIFEGSVDEAIEAFPASLNVAAAVAHASGLWQETRVKLLADPETPRTRHHITASGRSGSYRFDIENTPFDEKPSSSAVVAQAVVRGIRRMANPVGSFV